MEQHCSHVAEYYRQKHQEADERYRQTRKHKDQYAAADYLRAWLIYEAGAQRNEWKIVTRKC